MIQKIYHYYHYSFILQINNYIYFLLFQMYDVLFYIFFNFDYLDNNLKIFVIRYVNQSYSQKILINFFNLKQYLKRKSL